MRILYIHQYFKTPSEGGCIRSYHIGERLVDEGHEVIVITASSKAPSRIERIGGMSVHYLHVPYDNQFSYIKRIIAFFKFTIGGARLGLKQKNIDLAYVMTTPLTTGLIALWLRRTKQIPFIFEVGDLWPEVPVKLGILKNKLLQNLSYGLERKIYQSAKEIVALSPEIATYISKIVPEKQIEVIPNFSDNEFFQSKNKKLADEISVLYCGTVGYANHLQYLLSLAKHCEKKYHQLKFTIIGAGAEFEEIQLEAKEISNVQVLAHVNRDELRDVIERHDIFYISFLNNEMLHTGSPNKFFEGLAAGKMIISNLSGWTAKYIDRYRCGFHYNPENLKEFDKKFLPYSVDSNEITEAQENARRLAEQHFDKNRLIDKLIQLISQEETAKAPS